LGANSPGIVGKFVTGPTPDAAGLGNGFGHAVGTRNGSEGIPYGLSGPGGRLLGTPLATLLGDGGADEPRGVGETMGWGAPPPGTGSDGSDGSIETSGDGVVATGV